MYFKIKCNKFFLKFLLLSISILFLSLFLLFKVGKKFNNKIVSFSELQSEKIVRSVLNNVILYDKDLPELDDLYIVNINSLGEIQSIDFNSELVNDYIAKINVEINNILSKLSNNLGNEIKIDKINNNSIFKDKNGIFINIPYGIVYGNSLLSNIGPKIPIRLFFNGNFEAYLASKITDYGINNSLVNIFIKYKIKYSIFLPMKTEEKVVESDIPILVKVIVGKIPNYYSSGINENTNLFSN